MAQRYRFVCQSPSVKRGVGAHRPNPVIIFYPNLSDSYGLCTASDYKFARGGSISASIGVSSRIDDQMVDMKFLAHPCTYFHSVFAK